MLSEYTKNEILMACEHIKSQNILPENGTVINVIGSHILCDHLTSTFSNLNSKTEYGYTVYQCDNADALSSTVKKQCFLYCLDTRANDADTLTDLSKALDYATKTDDAQFLALFIVPPYTKREDVQALSEMELSKVTADSVLAQAEAILTSFASKITVKEIRFDNFLTEDSTYNALNLTKIVNDIIDTKRVAIDSADAFDIISAISMSDAISAVFTVLTNGQHGNIYNASGEALSVYELKSFIYETLCTYGVKLDYTNSDEVKNKSYRILDTGKLTSVGYAPLCSNKERLLYALSGLLPNEYDIIADKTNSIYSGKLGYIREMELELLNIVDRICKDNNITYFLSGGTMLGAVRHKGFIPWDDDIDIAMLRDEYEKFKKACIEQLPKKYKYQSYTNKNGYHYFFDRITINDTYFSTKYSDKFEMLKGISMDIFVFDKTSDKKFFQKLHFKRLMTLRMLMNVRWINHPRKDKNYRLSKMLLPILRLFSMDTYSKRYDKLLRKYEKRKTKTVLPPATDHKWRGVMPSVWFEQVTDANFDGVMSYIPTGYDNYLKQWYGDDYMELLPLSQRIGSHDFYRLDIGNEIRTTNNTDDKNFNYKGELL